MALVSTEWIEKNINDEEQKKAAIDASNCYITVYAKDSIIRKEIDPIVWAAKSKYKAVWSIGTDLLWVLSKS